MLDQNNKNLEHYNYSQHPNINFKHALNKPRLEITTNFLTGHMKEKFGEEYVKEIKIKQKNAKCQTFIIIPVILLKNGSPFRSALILFLQN